MSEGRRCFYCLDDKVNVCICLDCRSKLERMENEVKRLRRDVEGWRNSYWRLMNEKKRALGRPKGKR